LALDVDDAPQEICELRVLDRTPAPFQNGVEMMTGKRKKKQNNNNNIEAKRFSSNLGKRFVWSS
jgi:hypothetical protein